jgi:hypothetical protein
MTPTPEPEPRPRKRRTTRRLLVVVAVVLVVCCGGGAVASWALFKWYNSAAGPAQATTETFLTDLEKDDTAGAYGLLCADVRTHLSQDAFANLVHAEARLRSHKIVGTSISTVNGTTTSLVTADLTRDGNIHDRHVVRVVKDGGSWRVCGTPY